METQAKVITKEMLNGVWTWLGSRGYTIVGPTIRDGAIVYDELESAASLPEGWTDEQSAGKYRLKRRDDKALFGYAVGPHSWKKYLFPSRRRLWKADRAKGEVRVEAEPLPKTKYAFLGVRSCELHAIAIQDKVFIAKEHTDPYYQAQRESLFLIAVNCTQAGGTCFCVSMKTGPRCSSGYDVVLTEVLGEGSHEFVVEPLTENGRKLVASLTGRRMEGKDAVSVDKIVEKTASGMGRTLDTTGIKELLTGNPHHPRWEEVANRCLTCANCTLVCPTCFCSTVEDTTDLTGDHAERWRRWDSCFTMDFSYVHGGSVRSSTLSRYRQWMTHKLATWHDQFDTSGCVGCGRCISWCPVGIDITEETKAIREGKGRDD